MNRVLSACAGIVFAGALLGYIGSFWEYRNEFFHGADRSKFAAPWLSIVAAPGRMTARSLRSGDYEPMEAWKQDRHRIALWNGLFLAPLGLFAGWRRPSGES
ncbi:MAG: hypothetical protein FJ221_18585 [Lentisphaerae bacterium]|nr:hypothetical protein [Lentisphaerota bacterium]